MKAILTDSRYKKSAGTSGRQRGSFSEPFTTDQKSGLLRAVLRENRRGADLWLEPIEIKDKWTHV